MDEFTQTATTTVATVVSQNLYNDFKSYLVGNIPKKIAHVISDLKIKKFDSVTELSQSLAGNILKEGTIVKVKCKPTMFGPFLRNHMLSPIIGNSTELRLGPRIVSNNPILGMFGQITSNLVPVGLFPHVGKGVSQVTLLDITANALGFTGIFPGINDAVVSLPALIRSDLSHFFHRSCVLQGTVRLIGPENFERLGYTLEAYEQIRQKNNLWFIDATDQNGECRKNEQNSNQELWGGLYSSGHMEIDRDLKLNQMIEATMEVFKKVDIETKMTQNTVKDHEILFYGKGARMLLYPAQGFYSIHMDADLSTRYGEFKEKFDSINDGILGSIVDLCSKNNAVLNNAFDLDFSYTDSAKSFTIMQSLGANEIKDPTAMAIRDWYRRKNTTTESLLEN